MEFRNHPQVLNEKEQRDTVDSFNNILQRDRAVVIMCAQGGKDANTLWEVLHFITSVNHNNSSDLSKISLVLDIPSINSENIYNAKSILLKYFSNDEHETLSEERSNIDRKAEECATMLDILAKNNDVKRNVGLMIRCPIEAISEKVANSVLSYNLMQDIEKEERKVIFVFTNINKEMNDIAEMKNESFAYHFLTELSQNSDYQNKIDVLYVSTSDVVAEISHDKVFCINKDSNGNDKLCWYQNDITNQEDFPIKILHKDQGILFAKFIENEIEAEDRAMKIIRGMIYDRIQDNMHTFFWYIIFTATRA